MRKCSKCNELKDIQFFHRKNQNPDGLDYMCKECKKESNYLYYINFGKRDLNLKCKYLSMVGRCKYSKKSNWKYYGGRGIKVLWKSYEEFKRDMFDEYVKHIKDFGFKDTTLDRIDVNGDYCKENCRWATIAEQSKNKRKK